MIRAKFRHLACGAALSVLAVAWAAVELPIARGADGVRPGRQLAAKTRGGSKGLPKCYSQFVTPEQGLRIAKIQEDYRPRIEALQARIKALNAQLKAVTTERDAKIDAVLTPQQKRQIAEAAAAAKEKAKEKREKKKAEADAVRGTGPKPAK